ncbi:MAG: DUF262 domain-containing protein [Erysipelotrichaceae bacterium]|nr:DUF262 domain-containing protein [Erysipelotrichaceae bacterium]
MKADTLQLLGDLIGSNKVLFRIPVYQRNYDWSEANCTRLLDDVKTIIDTGVKHFLGTIVYMASDGNDFVLHDYIVIDGQQRLTTMMILLKALYDKAEELNDQSVISDVNDYLQNRNCIEDYKIKLKPINSDNEQFLALLNNDENKISKSGHIWLNYERCKKYIDRWIDNGIKPAQILRALEKLEVVGIALKQGEDDPQIIFESINSTGLELSNSDLIRNYLLMSDDNQEKLYYDYWLPIENNLKKNTDYTDLNMFFMQYIVLETKNLVNERKLYDAFVKLFKDKEFNHESCLKELSYYSEIYKAFVNSESNKYSAKVMKCLKSLKQLKQTTCYPFLLRVFDDYENNVIDDNTLEKTVQFVLSYLIRRSVCGIPSNSLRSLFAYLYSRVFKVKANKKKYYESINKFLATISSRDVTPSDNEFRTALQTSNIYGNNALCKFLMMDIENGDGKEVLKPDNLTIEHIMPQTLTMEWSKYISEDEHEQYLHTLGNLSVTGYNSELSNKSFSEKKQIIKTNSKAVVLNSDVWDKEVWTINDIKNRGKRLSEIVAGRYGIEMIEDDSIEFEYLKKVTLLDDLKSVTNKKLVSFFFDGETYRQTIYASMLYDVIRLCDEKKPGVLEELAKQNWSFNGTYKHAHLSRDSDLMRWAWDVKDGIYMEANISAHSIMRFIKALVETYGFEYDIFYASIVDDEVELSGDEEFEDTVLEENDI